MHVCPRKAITTRLICNDKSYFIRLPAILYGGSLVPDIFAKRIFAGDDSQYMLGTSVNDRGSGYTDGKQDLLRGAPENTNVGIVIDEPAYNELTSCLFKDLSKAQHKILMEKIKGLPEWDGFNHDHRYIVVTLKPLELGETLKISYFWKDQHLTTYSYALSQREVPVIVDAMIEGKDEKNLQHAKQVAGLQPGRAHYLLLIILI